MIINLFAGPGGWSEGLRALGLADVGIEWDAAACSTRAAAGHATIRANLEDYPPGVFRDVTGLIASPPCQDFSVAGRRAGRTGTRGRLIDLVPTWVKETRPRWIACEQVPPALDIWREHAAMYREWGYSAWAGILNAANYGVPQTRQRAILIARLDGPATPPEPTHAKDPVPTMFGELAPWVTMADALGWGATQRPYVTLAGGTAGGPCYDMTGGSGSRRTLHTERDAGRWRPGSAFNEGAADCWPWQRPSPTIAGTNRVAHPHHRGDDESMFPAGRVFDADQIQTGDYDDDGPIAIRLTLADALTLQGFRPDYPVQGTRTKQFEQVGNAIPPPLAAHVIVALTQEVSS